MANINDYIVDVVDHSDCVVASAAGVATATAAAVGGRHNVVCKIDASYSVSTVTGLLTVTITTIGGARSITKYIHGAGALDFGIYGLQQALVNTSITAALADGGGGAVGTVAMTYFTTGPNY